MTKIGCYKINKKIILEIQEKLNDILVVDITDTFDNEIELFLCLEKENIKDKLNILYDRNIPVVRICTTSPNFPTTLIFNDDLLEKEELDNANILSTIKTNKEFFVSLIHEFIKHKISLSFNDFPDNVTLEDIKIKLKKMVYQIEINNGCEIGHGNRVATCALALGKKLNLNKEDMSNLYFAALLHDIGKSAVANRIFLKKGKINAREFDIMKLHPIFSSAILTHKMYDPIKNIILYHHERCDGSGYPKGLNKNNIPIGSKIIAIVDSYDAMLDYRIYSKPMPKQLVIEELVYKDDKYDEFLVNLFSKSV